jgi:hypothetical protein
MWERWLTSAPNIAGTLSISAGLALIPASGLLDDSKFREKCERAAQATAERMARAAPLATAPTPALAASATRLPVR